MNFTFSEDQLLFQESVRDFLVNEVTPERIRQSWAASRRSNPIEALIASMIASGPAAKRPPHIWFDECSVMLKAPELPCACFV